MNTNGLALVELPQDAVTAKNGHPITTSQQVARAFGKEHRKVLRDIRELDVPEDFRQSNFGLASYLDEQGKPRPMVEISRDGFTFLVMGFTGKDAVKFKLAYIKAFNTMEEALRSIGAQDHMGQPLTPSQFEHLLDARVVLTGAEYLALKKGQAARLTPVPEPVNSQFLQRMREIFQPGSEWRPQEVSAQLGWGRSLIYWHISIGQLPCIRYSQRNLRLRGEDVMTFLESVEEH